MLVAYDGAAFHGFSPNPGVPTVGGTLGKSMRRVLGYEPPLTCAGRTDARVHAWGQVVSFDGLPLDTERLRDSLNSLCGPAIVVREVTQEAPDFDARFSATGRTYRYRVLNRIVPDPFLHPTTWHVPHPLDLEAMAEGGVHLLGPNDYSSFCRRRTVMVEGVEIEATRERNVRSIEWRRERDDVIELWISAGAFCHQMVRSITGTLVDVGLGKFKPGQVAEILEARDRSVAGYVAPPHGLTLWNVDY